MRILFIGILLLGAGCAHPAIEVRSRCPDQELKTLVLDPGHSPAFPGAASASGRFELEWNDRFTERLRTLLQDSEACLRICQTRGPVDEVDLSSRVKVANSCDPDLLVSIHHDSAQESLLEPLRNEKGEVRAWKAKRPIRGYSLFVSRENSKYSESLTAAGLIAAALAELGRPPTLHHAENIPGENRELLDPKLGIYQYPELRVLRRSSGPAVLVELGVIVDPVDEAYVSLPENQDRMARAIARGITRFLSPNR